MNIIQAGNFDSQKEKLDSYRLPVELTHNVAFKLPLTPKTIEFQQVYGCLIANDGKHNVQKLIGFSWTLDTDNVPIVTAQLLSGSGTFNCTVVLLIKR